MIFVFAKHIFDTCRQKKHIENANQIRPMLIQAKRLWISFMTSFKAPYMPIKLSWNRVGGHTIVQAAQACLAKINRASYHRALMKEKTGGTAEKCSWEEHHEELFDHHQLMVLTSSVVEVCCAFLLTLKQQGPRRWCDPSQDLHVNWLCKQLYRVIAKVWYSEGV